MRSTDMWEEKIDLNRPPRLVADLHTHTLASGHAYSTMEENVAAAKARGLRMIAITDHGPAVIGAPVLYYFMNQVIWPRVQNGVTVLRGAEANILPDGTLDIPNDVMARLDFVLAGFHYDAFPPGKDRAVYTKALFSAMEDPHVLAISHPGNPLYPIDYEAFVRKAIEKHILIEVNNSSLSSDMRPGSWKNCRKIVRLGKKLGATFLADSDAHVSYLVGETSSARKLLMEEGVPETQILNTDVEKIVAFLKMHGSVQDFPL